MNNINSPSNSLHIDTSIDKKSSKLKPQFDFEKLGIDIDDIKDEAEKLIRQNTEAKESKGLFTVKSANSWIELAKTRPIPQMLFGEFWFESENTINFEVLKIFFEPLSFITNGETESDYHFGMLSDLS